MLPFLAGEDPRNYIEGQNSIYRFGVGINGKSNSKIVHFGIGAGGALLERFDRQAGEAFPDRPARLAAQHLAVEALGIVIVENWRIHLPASKGRPVPNHSIFRAKR